MDAIMIYARGKGTWTKRVAGTSDRDARIVRHPIKIPFLRLSLVIFFSPL